MKKIAVPTEEGRVAAHFGRCPQYTIFQAGGTQIEEKKVIENPGHRPGFLPRFLNDRGVDCILAGGMGIKAVNLFQKNDIEVVTGAQGEVESCVRAYLNDSLKVSDNICDHDDHYGRHGEGGCRH